MHNQVRPRGAARPKAPTWIGDVEIDFVRLRATRNGRPLHLTHREFEILRYFVEHESQIVTRGDLLQAVWKQNAQTDTRTVDVHIVKLRQRIEPEPRCP